MAVLTRRDLFKGVLGTVAAILLPRPAPAKPVEVTTVPLPPNFRAFVLPPISDCSRGSVYYHDPEDGQHYRRDFMVSGQRPTYKGAHDMAFANEIARAVIHIVQQVNAKHTGARL